jgi:hypothetical protein
MRLERGRPVIELLFLIFFLPKRMKILARERDLSALNWTLAAVGAWLGVEMLIIFAWVVVSTVGWSLWGWPEDPEKSPITFVVYFVALVGGMVAADLVRRRLTAKPITRDVKQWKGILS